MFRGAFIISAQDAPANPDAWDVAARYCLIRRNLPDSEYLRNVTNSENGRSVFCWSIVRARTVFTARRGASKRTRPAGLFRDLETWPSASRISVNAGWIRLSKCSPEIVAATLRVVRESNRTPISSSTSRIAWLTADGVMPSRFAAFVKLRSSATVRNVNNELKSSAAICEFYSQLFVDLGAFSTAQFAISLEIEKLTRCLT
jgi:hypothetical protein